MNQSEIIKVTVEDIPEGLDKVETPDEVGETELDSTWKDGLSNFFLALFLTSITTLTAKRAHALGIPTDEVSFDDLGSRRALVALMIDVSLNLAATMTFLAYLFPDQKVSPEDVTKILLVLKVLAPVIILALDSMIGLPEFDEAALSEETTTTPD